MAKTTKKTGFGSLCVQPGKTDKLSCLITNLYMLQLPIPLSLPTMH